VVGNLVNSTYGRGFLAVRDDEIAAEAMGINTTKYKVLAFVTGAFFAGIAGGLYAHFKQYISPEGFNFMKSVDIVVMVILGGMGNTIGVIIAAILLTILPEVLRWLAQSDWLVQTTNYFTTKMPPEQQESVLRRVQEFFSNRMIFFSIILIVVMLLRPQGLFTRSQRRLAHK
jgi:branched-chain amino acid transport system permease protein